MLVEIDTRDKTANMVRNSPSVRIGGVCIDLWRAPVESWSAATCGRMGTMPAHVELLNGVRPESWTCWSDFLRSLSSIASHPTPGSSASTSRTAARRSCS